MSSYKRAVVDTPAKSDDTPKINKYYESVAIAFRYAKFIVLFFTIIFLMLILSFFREEVSVENFQYLLKYMSSDDSTFITTQKIHYPTSDSKALDIFAGDFVSAGTNGVTLYDTNGNTVLDIDTVISQPVFAIGKKYGLCYDLSGYSYIVFNTFAKLSQEEFEFPISDAAIDDRGNYAILTKNKEYRTIINVYDSDFELTSRIYKNKYTFDFDINSDRLVYVTADALDSRFLTEVNVIKHKSDSENNIISLYNEFPIGVRFLGDNIILVTDKSLRFFSFKGGEFSQGKHYSFVYLSPGGFVNSDEHIILYFEKNTIGSENDIKIYAKDGELVLTTTLSGKINSVDLRDNFAVVQTAECIYRIDIEKKRIDTVKIDSGAEKVIIQADYTVLACYKNYAKLIDFKNIDDTIYIKAGEG